MTRRWFSCAATVDWHTSRYRHLVTTSTARFDRGWTDTLCGATGTPGSFRSNTSKPPCPACCEQAGLAVPNPPGLESPPRKGSTMPSTTKKKRPVSKHDTLPKASKPPRDAEDAKAQARAFASRAQKRGQDYTTAYIRQWRRLSGMKNRPVGPVA